MQATQKHVRANLGWQLAFCLVTVIAVTTVCSSTHAQTLIGSSGAGWQTWTLAKDASSNFVDLNSNGSPYWDVPLLTYNDSNGAYGGNAANKSVGWCMTSNGDCQGVGSALYAPGALPFWGMPYTAANDTGGAIDPKMYFKTNSSGEQLQATLYLNFATNNFEINDFGWFETNSTGTVIGTKHILFHGTGFPTNPSAPPVTTPDPIGKVVNFTPTQYFGYYYQDVSDEEDYNGPAHGCYAYTIFNLNDEDCTEAGNAQNNPGQGDHVFAIFLQQNPGRAPIYWVAGQDPSLCSNDGDCNLTIVKVRRLPLTD
jgi:hypothetical protein